MEMFFCAMLEDRRLGCWRPEAGLLEAGGWAAEGPEGNLHHVHLNTETPGILWGLGAGHWRRVLSSDDGSGPKLYNEVLHTGVTS